MKRLPLITINRHLKLMLLVLFYVGEGARIQGHGKFSLDIHLNSLGASIIQMLPVFLHPEVSLRVHRGVPLRWVTAVANGLIFVELEWWTTFFTVPESGRGYVGWSQREEEGG